MAIFQRGPLTGASNTGGVYAQIAILDESMTRYCSVPSTSVTVHRAVYRTDGDASMNLCLSQHTACTVCTTTSPRHREENRIYLYAAVNLKRILENALDVGLLGY